MLVECEKKGGMTVFEWLMRLLNTSFDMYCSSRREY